MIKRRTGVLVAFAVAASVFLLPASPASASTSTNPNACINSVTANNSQVGVDMSATDLPASVSPGDPIALTNITQSLTVPGDIFVAGYRIFLYGTGPLTVPADIKTVIEGTNTVEGTQTTNTASATISTTISDPTPTNRNSGDETATPGSLTVTYADQTWTAGASGTINFREDTVLPLSQGVGGIIINALVGGAIPVEFDCSPGTVAPSNPPPGDPNPGIPTYIDPASPFASTQIVVPNTAPTANAGPDQTVDSGATVQLDGSGSTDPENDTLTYAWTAPAGITLSDPSSATPTFTAPTVSVPTTLTFDLQVCDPGALCSTDSVDITVNPPPPSTISIGDASATEGGAENFTVSLSGPQPAPVTVDFATADGTATAGSDYTAATGTVTFTPGSTSQTVTVQTLQDTVFEGTETFNVNLSNPSANATILDGTGVGTILDDEVPNQAPTANAGPDQTVDSGATVQLDGSQSTDPESQALTYMWTAPAGITLSDPTSATPTFTAPTGPATLTFTLQVCDPEPLCDTDTVVISVRAPVVIDADGETIVSGPTKAKAGSKTYTLKVTNNGTGPLTFNLSALTGSVTVGGAVVGTVAGPTGTDTINPGRSVRYKMVWTHGTLTTGLAVVYTGCVNVPGDIDGPAPADCTTAQGKPTS